MSHLIKHLIIQTTLHEKKRTPKYKIVPFRSELDGLSYQSLDWMTCEKSYTELYVRCTQNFCSNRRWDGFDVYRKRGQQIIWNYSWEKRLNVSKLQNRSQGKVMEFNCMGTPFFLFICFTRSNGGNCPSWRHSVDLPLLAWMFSDHCSTEQNMALFTHLLHWWIFPTQAGDLWDTAFLEQGNFSCSCDQKNLFSCSLLKEDYRINRLPWLHHLSLAGKYCNTHLKGLAW